MYADWEKMNKAGFQYDTTAEDLKTVNANFPEALPELGPGNFKAFVWYFKKASEKFGLDVNDLDPDQWKAGMKRFLDDWDSCEYKPEMFVDHVTGMLDY